MDNKKIEEKALTYFKTFIVDSDVISQFISENDKEPCWDGHLYLYSDGIKDKAHLEGRVPVQVKGTMVDDFETKKWKFKLMKDDLKAYLHEPTFFIVCQIRKGTNEKKLFYRELLPNLVRKLLKDMGGNLSRMTVFKPMTQNLQEFEEQLNVFMGNSRRMTSFANKNLLSMKEAANKGIKEFSFLAPSRISSYRQLLRYLSTHVAQLYAKIPDYDIEMPVSDGPVKFKFSRTDEGDIKVGDKVFYKGYKSEIIDGRVIVTVSEDLTVSFPLDETDKVAPIINMKPRARYLNDAIHETEFMLALNETGELSIGGMNLQISSADKERMEELYKKLTGWKEFSNVLDKMHVTKPFDLTTVNKEDEAKINVLIETIGKGNTIPVKNQQTALLTWNISNVKLLLICIVDEEGNFRIGDYFDKSFNIGIEKDDGSKIEVSTYSYLQKENLWGSIDNIDYDGIVESAQRAAQNDAFCYQLSNYDVLSMIKAADKVEGTDDERRNKLLCGALKLDEWLIESDPNEEMKQVHMINKLQIIKRQRYLSDEEKDILYRMINDDKLDEHLKFAVYLMLDNHQDAERLFCTFSEEDKKVLRDYPIWRFYNNFY